MTRSDAGSSCPRLALLLAGCAAVLTIGLVVAPGSDAAPALPEQGVYEYCPPARDESACLARLRQISRGGFSAVLNYRQLTADRSALLRYARAAERQGVEIIWPLKDAIWWRLGGDPAAAYPRLAAACGCNGRGAFLRWFVDLVRDLPATWGYYVGDETPPGHAAAVSELGRSVRRLDPSHPRLFVAQGYHPGRDLAPFAFAADLLGVDWYPVGFDLPISTVSTVTARAARIARAASRQSAVVLQSFSWSQYPEVGAPAPRWPRRDELRLMRDLAVRAARPALVLWYSYFDVMQARHPGRRWRNLRWAAFGKPERLGPLHAGSTAVAAAPGNHSGDRLPGGH
jgi:hypothetical protein